ncbi:MULTISPECIES: outer membrane protein assembly factor BamE [Roseobacteraceae]|jgi:outer membrane protein assembly factor BamE (lipoprotein component of BamABCDE complex)|uniref:SmpA / OmlA family protein n=1 Tax=Pseudosulfitobacter pseudonitzschiae TaxID=1402135 RepID=A0A221JZU3_9RHOB|nr:MULTISPECIES: outer membrane protein assembly factor BamE [Roseobacteraceae]ASM72107.1 SmpA / OmlA family protein [Pseudosulfitobacter pseudonitzschiae]
MGIRSITRIAGISLLCLTLGACTPSYRNHGYIPPDDVLNQIVVGVDTRASVEETVGPPGTSGVANGGGYYYVRSRIRTFGFKAPDEVERQVLAISFDSAGVVSNIETFGLENGQVVPLTRRVTESAVSNKTFLRQLLGNLGRIGPSGLGG